MRHARFPINRPLLLAWLCCCGVANAAPVTPSPVKAGPALDASEGSTADAPLSDPPLSDAPLSDAPLSDAPLSGAPPPQAVPPGAPEPPPGQFPAAEEVRQDDVEPADDSNANDADAPYEPPLPDGIVLPPLRPVPKGPISLPAAALHPLRIGAPRFSLWGGLRAGWLFPQGTLWLNGWDDGRVCCFYSPVHFTDVARSSPKLQADLGLRFGRRYNVFGTFEFSPTRPTSDGATRNSQQKWGQLAFTGLGFRFSTDPDGLGMLFEVALGYRTFRTEWEDGAVFEGDKSGIALRFALGADIRLSRWLSLTPQLSLATGSFSRLRFTAPESARRSVLTSLDELGAHHIIGLDLGAHFDIWDLSAY